MLCCTLEWDRIPLAVHSFLIYEDFLCWEERDRLAKRRKFSSSEGNQNGNKIEKHPFILFIQESIRELKNFKYCLLAYQSVREKILQLQCSIKQGPSRGLGRLKSFGDRHWRSVIYKWSVFGPFQPESVYPGLLVKCRGDPDGFLAAQTSSNSLLHVLQCWLR